MSACPLCADSDERDKAHCSLCSGTGCDPDSPEYRALKCWSTEEKLVLAMQRVAQLESEKSRMDWLESNILALFHGRATCSVQMDGRNVTLQYTDRNHRKLRLIERSIRAAIDAAMESCPRT